MQVSGSRFATARTEALEILAVYPTPQQGGLHANTMDAWRHSVERAQLPSDDPTELLRLNIPADAHVIERRLMQHLVTFQRFVDLLIQRTADGELDDDGLHDAMQFLEQELRLHIPAGAMQHHPWRDVTEEQLDAADVWFGAMAYGEAAQRVDELIAAIAFSAAAEGAELALYDRRDEMGEALHAAAQAALENQRIQWTAAGNAGGPPDSEQLADAALRAVFPRLDELRAAFAGALESVLSQASDDGTLTYAVQALQSMRAHQLQNPPDSQVPFPAHETLSDLALAAGRAMANLNRSRPATSEAERDAIRRALFDEVNGWLAGATSNLAARPPASAELLEQAFARLR
jgi:hypothetical protein